MPLSKNKNKYMTLDEEFIDKRKTHEVFECTNDYEYNEDDCLYKCLVTRFEQEFGCHHIRLALLHNYNDTEGNWNETLPICGFDELYNKTIEFFPNSTKVF